MINLKQFYFHDAIEYAFSQAPICGLPKSIKSNSVFCIDLNKFELQDVLADDNGSYKSYGNRIKFYLVEKNQSEFQITRVNKKNLSKKNEKIFIAEKVFYRSLVNKNFLRKTIRITNFNNPNSFKILVLGYIWIDDSNTEFNLKVHGNSKKDDRPYIRRSKSILEKTKEASLQSESASLKYSQLIDEAKKGSDSLSNYPRNIGQLYKFKSILSKDPRNKFSKDEYADFLINRQKSILNKIIFK